MPIYEYHCKSCKKDFEVLQKITEPPLAVCPACGKKVKRLISQTTFTLKGGGWYKDGYASGGSAHSTKTSKPAAAEKSAPAKKNTAETKK
jgi:putative FmdB family regulatory protein